MNVHYLELFYHVAKHEGITQAVRKMPYGIQQPAVSAQILKLEEELNVTLFQRRPFALTDAGNTLYQFIEPFFSKLPRITSELQGKEEQHLRLGASQTILAHYLPVLLKRLRKDLPNVRLTLEQVGPSEAEQLLLTDQIDIAVSVLHNRPATGLRQVELLSTPLTLLAHKDAKHASFAALCKQAVRGNLALPLISMNPEERICQIFQKELGKRKLHWDPDITVSQLELVQSYVAEGFGYGVYAEVPGLRLRKAVQRIPLPDFPPLTIGCMHRAHLGTVAQRFLDSAHAFVETLRKLPPTH
ncbi:LysR family transcriptional regulator [bacterium]|nr:LysR family transcriptional regulator [bacterium]